MKLTHSSLFTLFFVVHAFAAAEIPNPGPRSKEEPKILWEEVQTLLPEFEQMTEAEFKDPQSPQRRALSRATGKLDRLVDRYPRDPRAPDALELLTRLNLREGDSAGATERAKQFLLTDSASERAQRVRALLIEAYLGRNRLTEARATAKELIAKSRDDQTRGSALVSLARIETRLGNYSEARARLDALPASYSATERDGQYLEIGVRECAATIRAPGRKARGDDPWISYFEKKNLCLKTLAASQHDKTANRGHPVWCEEFSRLSLTLEGLRINPFQKNRLQAELAKTSDLAKPMNCENRP